MCSAVQFFLFLRPNIHLKALPVAALHTGSDLEKMQAKFISLSLSPSIPRMAYPELHTKVLSVSTRMGTGCI